jgi:formaldehyde-activating enzyme involved in methanogenesis
LLKEEGGIIEDFFLASLAKKSRAGTPVIVPMNKGARKPETQDVNNHITVDESEEMERRKK